LGLTLPWIIRKLKIEPYSIAAEEYEVRMLVVNNTIEYIESDLSLVKEDLLRDIKNKYEIKFNRLQRTDLPAGYFNQNAEETAPTNIFNEFSQLQIDVISHERKTLDGLHREGNASEEILHKIERELDLEETRLRMEIYQG
jgi:CPA1 family monovalent cation:H+ antiporter